MGGDNAPREVVRGAIQAACELPSVARIFLVGDSAAIQREIEVTGEYNDNVIALAREYEKLVGEYGKAASEYEKYSSMCSPPTRG